jgi:hypothetical protein
MQGYLEDRAGGSFRPEATLSRDFLVHAKTIPLSGTVVLSSKELYRLYGDNFQWAAGNVMYYTWKHELKYGETMFDLIRELDRVGNVFCSPSHDETWTDMLVPSNQFLGSQASSSWSPIWDEREQLTPTKPIPEGVQGCRSLIAYAVEFDLQLFVQETLQKDRRRINAPEGQLLLYHALTPAMPSRIGLPNISTSHAMVGVLLDLHADINIKVLDRLAGLGSFGRLGITLWRVFLHSISAARSSMTSPRELPYSLPGVPGIVTQSSYTATDMLSLQSDVRRDDEESDEDRLNYWLATQGDPLLNDPPPSVAFFHT